MSCMIQTVRLVTKLFTLEQYTQGVVSISNESGKAEHRISLAVLPCVESASQAHNFMVISVVTTTTGVVDRCLTWVLILELNVNYERDFWDCSWNAEQHP